MKFQYEATEIEGDSYYVRMYCKNCGGIDTEYHLPLRYPVSEKVIQSSECNYCSCKGYLVKYWEQVKLKEEQS